MKRIAAILTVVAVMTGSLGLVGYAVSASKIGVAAAVRNTVSGSIGGASSQLSSGDGVFQNQLISSGQDSSAQLLFDDETALTVGPGSQVTLDRFVYDPEKKVGDIVFNTTKGAFRFVTGNAKSSSYKIKTPVALIGVRGTIFDWLIDEFGRLLILLTEGAVEVTLQNGETVLMDDPGTILIVNPDGTYSGPFDNGGGQFWAIKEGVPHPLFGREVLNNFSDRPSTFSPSDLNDALDNTNHPPEVQDTGGGGYGYICSPDC